jgi:hypothetical protein
MLAPDTQKRPCRLPSAARQVLILTPAAATLAGHVLQVCEHTRCNGGRSVSASPPLAPLSPSAPVAESGDGEDQSTHDLRMCPACGRTPLSRRPDNRVRHARVADRARTPRRRRRPVPVERERTERRRRRAYFGPAPPTGRIPPTASRLRTSSPRFGKLARGPRPAAARGGAPGA